MDEQVLKAMTGAMFRLRMNLAGHSSYSGTPSKIDKGWAEMVMEGLDIYGCRVVPIPQEERQKPTMAAGQATR